MTYRRKDFLKISGGLALAGLASKDLFSFFDDDKKKIKTFGLQLYTVRDDMLKDPKGVLRSVADDGYKFVESYEGDKGMFWGMSNTEFKKYLDSLGIYILSSHCDINKNFEQKAADASAIGMKYLISSALGNQKTIDDYKKLADQFNKCSEICKKAGIRFAFHGEDREYKRMEGQLPVEILLDNTDPSLMDYQMDIYWATSGGEDPEALLKKYSPRFKLCHVKDRAKGATTRTSSCILGEGSIDFPKILKTASQHGMQYYIVEQENYDNTTPLKCIAADAEYIKRLKI